MLEPANDLELICIICDQCEEDCECEEPRLEDLGTYQREKAEERDIDCYLDTIEGFGE